MKIAYITNSRFPSEKAQSDQVMQMCSAFAKFGHEVILIIPKRQGAVSDNPFTYYGREQTFTVEKIPCLDWTRFGRLGFWIQTASFVFALRKSLARLKVDVVYSRELYALIYKNSEAQRVWEAHSLHAAWWTRLIVKRLDRVITLTGASRNILIKQGVDQERVTVEPDAVDPILFADMPSREEARRKLGIAATETLCLYVGKFTTMGAPKGVEESIQAVRELRQENYRIRFLAVGGTEMELKKYANFISEGIELVGHRAQNTLKDVYAAADIVLMPFPFTEHYAYFMSPLKLFEYLMSGVPIISSDLPSIREIVNEKEVYFVEPGSVPSLKAMMVYAIAHPEQSIQLGIAGKRLASQYTWEARAERILNKINAK